MKLETWFRASDGTEDQTKLSSPIRELWYVNG